MARPKSLKYSELDGRKEWAIEQRQAGSIFAKRGDQLAGVAPHVRAEQLSRATTKQLDSLGREMVKFFIDYEEEWLVSSFFLKKGIGMSAARGIATKEPFKSYLELVFAFLSRKLLKPSCRLAPSTANKLLCMYSQEYAEIDAWSRSAPDKASEAAAQIKRDGAALLQALAVQRKHVLGLPAPTSDNTPYVPPKPADTISTAVLEVDGVQNTSSGG